MEETESGRVLKESAFVYEVIGQQHNIVHQNFKIVTPRQRQILY